MKTIAVERQSIYKYIKLSFNNSNIHASFQNVVYTNLIRLMLKQK